jgi:hypothetical protein
MSSCRSLFKKIGTMAFPQATGCGLRIPLPLAVTTSRRFITQGLWRIPAEEISSFQAAIFQELFHRFFRGRDSMKGNKENRR